MAWEVAVQGGLVKRLALPPPSALAATAFHQAGSGELFRNAWGSLSRVLVGFVAAAALGVVSGMVFACSTRSRQALAPVFDLLRPIPPIAWIPLAILWFGLGLWSTVFIVFVGAFFPISLGVCRGISTVSRAHVNAARCLGARLPLILTDVVVPAALPQILTGVRIGLGIAWTSVIAAEMIGARDGLGYAIQLGRTMLDTEAVFVNMITIGVIGWLMNEAIAYSEKRLTPWTHDIAVSEQGL